MLATARKTVVETDKPPVVFVSYSKYDKVWKDRLLGHIGVLEKAGLVSAWSDDDIDKGGEWLPPLVKAMKDASVAVCLISHNYLNTDFCVKHEIPYLIERAEEEGLHLLFFMVSPADYAAHHWLADRQWFLPKGQCVETDFAGRENLPFSWLVKDIRERLDERVQAQEKPSVSDYIRQAIAALEADAASKPELEPMPAVEPVELAFPALSDTYIDIERLPVTGKELFGRQVELQMLDDAWASDSTNIVALTAWGGVGKSTLVNKWTERLAKDNFRGAERVFAWSFYSQGMRDQATSADAFIDEALRFFGDDDPTKGSPWAKGERLAELVSQKRTLLLLDGMEPLQDKYQGIKDPTLTRLVECLAVENVGLCVITTREKVKELADFPDHVIEKDLEQISPEAGRALLRVKRVRGNDVALEQASQDFDNHALAINLLASYLRFYESRHISQAASIPDLPSLKDPHHRHPRRVMAAFVERFRGSPALDALHMIGLFDRPATGGCIAALRKTPAISGLTDKLSDLDECDWQDLLGELRYIGLLAPRNNHRRDELDAHPLVREHFGGDLRSQSEEAWIVGHDRLYEHLKTVPEKHQPDTLAEMAPLFQAVHHGCQVGRTQEALEDVFEDRIRRRASFYLTDRLGAWGADLALLACFFSTYWDCPDKNLSDQYQAWVLNEAARALRSLGRLADAVKPLSAATDRRVVQRDWENASISSFNLSEVKLALGDVSDAQTVGEISVRYADMSGDEGRRSSSLAILGAAHHYSGRFDQALHLFREAESLQGRRHPIIRRLFSLQGFYYFELLSLFERADRLSERAGQTLHWMNNDPDCPLLTLAVEHLSFAKAISMYKDERAATHFHAALDRLRLSGDIIYVCYGLLARAAFFRDVEEHEDSRRDLDEVMRIATFRGMRLHECDARLEYARLEIKQGQPDVARGHVKSAAKLVDDCGYHRRDGEVTELKEELGL